MAGSSDPIILPTTTIEDVIKYISNTPDNTNPNILKNLMEECGITDIEEKISQIMKDPQNANYNVWKDISGSISSVPGVTIDIKE